MIFPFEVSLAWDYASDENRRQPTGAWGKRKTRKIVCLLFAQQKATICAALFCLIRNRACFARFPNPMCPSAVGFFITGSIPFSCPAEPRKNSGGQQTRRRKGGTRRYAKESKSRPRAKITGGMHGRKRVSDPAAEPQN